MDCYYYFIRTHVYNCESINGIDYCYLCLLSYLSTVRACVLKDKSQVSNLIERIPFSNIKGKYKNKASNNFLSCMRILFDYLFGILLNWLFGYLIFCLSCSFDIGLIKSGKGKKLLENSWYSNRMMRAKYKHLNYYMKAEHFHHHLLDIGQIKLA